MQTSSICVITYAAVVSVLVLSLIAATAIAWSRIRHLQGSVNTLVARTELSFRNYSREQSAASRLNEVRDLYAVQEDLLARLSLQIGRLQRNSVTRAQFEQEMSAYRMQDLRRRIRDEVDGDLAARDGDSVDGARGGVSLSSVTPLSSVNSSLDDVRVGLLTAVVKPHESV